MLLGRITNYLKILVRKGAIAVYLEPWHKDIMDFLDLKKNSGEERRRAHDLFPALWISDLFMERVKNNETWTLFDPYDVPFLSESDNEYFNKYYTEYEKTIPDDKKIVLNAKDIWKKVLTEYFETGNPFLTFKDTANRANPNHHVGRIRSSNLCFTGDTIVAVADSRNSVPIKQLAEESNGKLKFPVYCAKEENGKWIDEIKDAIAFKTGTKKVITIRLENNDTFRCTPDHELALLDGGYVEAKDSLNKTLQKLGLDNGIKVIEIIDNDEIEDVYDLTVDDNHNFYIETSDSTNVLVHNCTEIFQNSSPNGNLVKIYTNEGNDFVYVTEDEIVELEDGTTKLGKKVTSLDSLKNNVYCGVNGRRFNTPELTKVYCVEKEKVDGETAVCNLASINLSKINKKEDIERVTKVAVRMLDNVIELNFYPLKKVKDTNTFTRGIGLGVMGEAEFLAVNKIMYGSQEHLYTIDTIMETISYNAIKASSELGKEKGNYPAFLGSNWNNGILPHDFTNDEVKELVDFDYKAYSKEEWDTLRELVSEHMRNGYLMAIAPTSSISILVGTTQSTEPIYKKKWYEENLSGLIPVVVPRLNPDTWDYYPSAYDVDQMDIVKAASIRQKWIDQGQSTNIFLRLDRASAKYLNDVYMLSHSLGNKSNYYLRSQSPDSSKADDSIVDRSIECEGCQ